MVIGFVLVFVFYNLAAQPGVRLSWGSHFERYVQDNLLATQSLFELVNGKIPIVYASSSSVYGNSLSYPVVETQRENPISPYGVTKLACDVLANSYRNSTGGRFVGTRYFTVYGPRQRPDMAFTKMCLSLLRGDKFEIYGDGKQSRDFTYVDDAVLATYALMNSEANGVYNVGGGSEVSLIEALGVFEKVSGLQFNLNFLSKVDGDVSRTGANTKRIMDETGWYPLTTITEGVSRHWAWACDEASSLIGKNDG